MGRMDRGTDEERRRVKTDFSLDGVQVFFDEIKVLAEFDVL